MFAIFMVISNSSCKRQEDPYAYLYKLPEVTSIGANTFGCICNGDIYSVRREVKGVMFGSRPHDIRVTIGPYYIDIKARTQLNSLPISWMRVTLLCDPRTLKLGRYTDVYRSVPGSESYVEITRFDRYVLSGTFRFDKYSLQRIPGVTLDEDGRLNESDDFFGCSSCNSDSIEVKIYSHVDSTVVDTYIEGRFDIQLRENDFHIVMD